MQRQPQGKILDQYRRPIEVVFWIGIVAIPLAAWFLPLAPPDRQQILSLAIASAIFVWILFRILIPRLRPRRWLNYIGILGSIAIISYLSYLLKPYNVHTEILYVAVIAGIGVIAGRDIAIHAVLLSILGYIVVVMLQPEIFTGGMTTTIGLHLLVLSLGGYAISAITGTIHNQMVSYDQQNRYLATLLQTGLVAASKENLRATLSQIAEMICHGLPVSVCRICLLTPDQQQLETFGAYPLREIPGWDHRSDSCYPLASFPELVQTLQTSEPLVLKKAELDRLIPTKHQLATFYQGVQTVCILSLNAKGRMLGVIVTGEARRWSREPFNQEKLGFLKTLASQTSSAIHTARLYEDAQRQIDRMAMLNQVAHAIGSTIELDDLLELIYEQLSKVLPSDTYFVSLYDSTQESLDMRILIDNEERFPAEKLPLGKGFSSWVIKNRQPLLVRHMSAEWDELPVHPIKLGQDRMSESWLGVPMMAGNELIGMLAIASYAPNAFDQEDVSLLSSVAAQAALAVDNAHHHAEVEAQARRDSLTDAYNHGHFLLRLNEAILHAGRSQSPVSLIMLDIDDFKEYNDTYGHQVGDQVLCNVVNVIQAHIKDSDIVGRWGGEEFGVVLPGASQEQALLIAERIRNSLAEARIAINGEKIGTNAARMPGNIIGDAFNNHKAVGAVPSPTVSQGIASFPDEAASAYELVNVADQALYRAKMLGRDQIQAASP